MDVALVRWPSDETLRQELAATRQPRLLLVDPDAAPPQCQDMFEDWVRLPVSRVDRDARIRTLESRAGAAKPSQNPRLAGTGTLEFGGERTQLSALQADLARAMIEQMGVVVTREALVATAWPGDDPSENTVDVAVGRLRRQLAPVGLRIRTVRSRGYLLTADPR